MPIDLLAVFGNKLTNATYPIVSILFLLYELQHKKFILEIMKKY